MAPVIPASEVSKHNTPSNLWIVVEDTIYDLTDFAPSHPGGQDILLRYAGRDATAAYSAVHSASLIKSTLPVAKHIGTIDRTNIPSDWTVTPAEPVSSTTATRPPPLDSLISTHDFARAANLSFPAKTHAFVTSAATDLHTYHRNSTAYSQITLRPRVLTDVSITDTSTTLLGRPVTSPIFASPTSLGKTVHPDGEKALAQACSELGIAQAISTSASYSLDEILSVIPRVQVNGKRKAKIPVFFQLYVDKHRPNSEKLLRRAGELGIDALILTVDAPVPGKREADERISAQSATVSPAVSSPMTGASASNDSKGGALGRVMGKYIDPSVSWRDIAWLRRHLPEGTPIVLKGIQCAADARRAVEMGVDVVMVSNHGGRSLDTAPATILVLLELQRCCPEVFDECEVWVDGGVMRGTDVFKALCLGAKGVGIGRGMLYGLGYGVEGVKRYVESKYFPGISFFWHELEDTNRGIVLNDELETTMKMMGVTSLDQVHPGLLNTLAVDHLIPTADDHPYAKWRPRQRSKI